MRHLLIPALVLLGLGLTACQTALRAAPAPMGSASDEDAFPIPPSATATLTDEPALPPPPGCAPSCCEPEELGCWQPSECCNTYLDGTLSFLPNVGLGIGGGRVFKRTHAQAWSWEVMGTWQFIDDESFANDGNPSAGDWLQLQVGFKTSSSPKARRHFTKRFGAVVLDASGEPNILQNPGTYYGVYGGLGFETDLSSSLTVGPEVAVMVVTHDDEFKIAKPIPQLRWHVTWWPGGRGSCLKKAPPGELYVGATALFSPGLGGGIEGGQVFHRSSLATWSFEILTGFQAPSDALFFEEDGEYAQIRGGIKASFQPCECGHWTARAGAVWLRSTARNEFLTGTGDYVGAYLGAGYEWDLGRRFTTGPELTLMGVAEESSSHFDFVPQLNWHFIYKL